MKKDTIYQLKKSDANDYLGFDDEQNEIYFKNSHLTYLKLNGIKKRKSKKKQKLIYEWWFQIIPKCWTQAFTHEVEVEKQELYESLFSTHDNIEEIAEMDASYDFMVNIKKGETLC